MLRWPDRETVDQAMRTWADQVVRRRSGVARIGYFGSYARGDWGVGSDVDIVVIVAQDDQPFARRAVAWDTTGLPTPADVLVYTTDEWEGLDRNSRFAATLERETVWVYESGAGQGQE